MMKLVFKLVYDLIDAFEKKYQWLNYYIQEIVCHMSN